MLDQLAPMDKSCAVQTCDLCQTIQSAPTNPNTTWQCKMCGQQYRSTNGGTNGGMAKSIVLSAPQLQALRTMVGRDASGKTNLVNNWWTTNPHTAGENFLDYNKDKPSRQYTRGLILNWAQAGEIKNILEVAFGGLHEYRAMRSKLRELDITYSGIDWTENFVTHAQQEFPECHWNQADIVRGPICEPADVVYSQHMLEHLPALEPAFSNMLRLARKKLVNIFFIPPKPFPNYEVVNWQHYPLYHNTYSIGHIEAICRAMNFKCNWVPFPNDPNKPQQGGLGEDVVLVAEKQ